MAAIILRRPAAAPVKQIVRPVGRTITMAPRSPEADHQAAKADVAERRAQEAAGAYQSPFKTSAHEEGGPRVVAAPVPAGKVKPVFKILGGKSIKPHSLAKPEPTREELEALGLIDEHGNRIPTSAERWPNVMIGEKVRITNSMFPWVLHYRPGDVAVVESISTAISSHQDDPIKYRNHTLRIISDGPTKGQRALLFRWEFEKHKDSVYIPSKVVKN